MTNEQARDIINVLRQTIERINDENRITMSIDISRVQNIINHWEETLDEAEVLRETTKGINQCPDGINTSEPHSHGRARSRGRKRRLG